MSKIQALGDVDADMSLYGQMIASLCLGVMEVWYGHPRPQSLLVPEEQKQKKHAWCIVVCYKHQHPIFIAFPICLARQASTETARGKNNWDAFFLVFVLGMCVLAVGLVMIWELCAGSLLSLFLQYAEHLCCPG